MIIEAWFTYVCETIFGYRDRESDRYRDSDRDTFWLPTHVKTFEIFYYSLNQNQKS